MLKSVPEQEWRKLHFAKNEAEKIIDRMVLVVSGLAEVFAEGNASPHIGLSFTERNKSVFGRIYTPFGAGRFVTGWAVNDELCGRLIAQREDIGIDEQIVWRPSLEVVVPSSGSPYVGEGDNRLKIFFERELGSMRGNSLFALGMSILYSFAQVPRT